MLMVRGQRRVAGEAEAALGVDPGALGIRLADEGAELDDDSGCCRGEPAARHRMRDAARRKNGAGGSETAAVRTSAGAGRVRLRTAIA